MRDGTTDTRGTRARMGTRDLLLCAAIGVIGGLVMVPAIYLQVLVTATLPMLYTIFTGTFILAPVLTQGLIRRPGAALIAAIVAGLASAPFSPRGIVAVLPMILVGLCYEAAPAIARYRSWPAWRWYLASFIVSIIQVVTVFRAFDLGRFPLWISATSVVAIPVSYELVTWFALFAGSRLRRRVLGVQSLSEDPGLGYADDAAEAGEPAHDDD